jgi:hypothetical protein
MAESSKPATPARPAPPEEAAAGQPVPDARAARLAEALRANLRRRKAQSRARADAAPPPPSPKG